MYQNLCFHYCQKKKKKDFTSFGQPTRLIACASYGNHVQYGDECVRVCVMLLLSKINGNIECANTNEYN